MKAVDEQILNRYYRETVRYPYLTEQKTRILKLLCRSKGLDSRKLEQLTARIHREFDISDIGDADCCLLVISEDDPVYVGLKLLRTVLQEYAQEHRDHARWRQDIMTEKNRNLTSVALLAYAEGQVSNAVLFWEKHMARTFDWEAMVFVAIAYAELGNYEKALYHSAFALYWAREVLMLEHSPVESLFNEMIPAAGERAPEICQQAKHDVGRRSGSITPGRIGFL